MVSDGLSIRAYARHRRDRGFTGGSPWSVQKALKEGRITRNQAGKIDPDEADRQWEDNTSPTMRRPPKRRAASPEPRPDSRASHSIPIPPLSQSRAIREAYQAKLSRLDYEERVGSLVPKDKVRAAAVRQGQIIRDRLLAVPDRLAAELAAVHDPRSVREILESELRQILMELADG